MASHRSRLCAAYIDVPRADFDATVAFWRDALPADAKSGSDPDYVSFGEATPGVELCVQGVGDPTSRIHLDIETDDIDAEVARLKALGADEVARIHSWVVMRDPVGIIFCVVNVQMPDAFGASATTWTS